MTECATRGLEMPPKSFYVLGTNWFCYVEPTTDDLAYLAQEELIIELCSKALDAFFGHRANDTLSLIDEAVEPMVGVLMGITEKGHELDEDSFNYLPSYLALGNCGKYKSSAAAEKAYEVFKSELAHTLEEESKKKKISKKKKNGLFEPPVPPESIP